MIEVEKLTKRFGQIVAVDNVTFSIDKGEIFTFLGPNGSGKTTTLRMLSTLIAPTAGRIVIDGKNALKNGSYVRSIIGFLTESPGMYEKISAYENLDFYSSFYAMQDKKRMENIEKFLKMFGLWERKDDLVATFSKGMKQKLAIARALIHEPKILFLDEPTAGLDPESAYMVRNFIQDLRQSSKTVFLCTHNLEEASSLSDQVCIIKNRIVKVATLEELHHTDGVKRFEISLLGDASALEGCIKRFSDIKSFTVQDNVMQIHVKDPEKNNPEIIRALVRQGADILSVHEIKESLEEIYLNLIRG